MDLVKLNIEDLLGCINGKDDKGENFKVNYPPHNNVKDEFKKFVNKEISERRKNSTIGSMRNFHNFIKKTMLINLTKMLKFKNVNLLDIAVGRGGDMFKWNEAGIENVFGFDKSNESINSINPFDQGAKERYRNNKINVNIEYHVGDAMNPTPELIQNLINFRNKNPISLLSCQFAIHYFFKSDTYLENVLKTFTPFLEKGGYFFGTTTDGSKIKEITKQKFTLFEISKVKTNEYHFKINDTFDKGNYFNSVGESTEYFVDFDKLIKIAAKYNLKPLFINLFEQIPGTNKYTTNVDTSYKPHFVTFDEIYNINNHGGWKGNLSPDELVLNNLYSTFLFVKV